MNRRSPQELLVTAATKPVIALWPHDTPGVDVKAVPGQLGPGKYNNIRNPSVTVYAPEAPDGNNGMAVIICPGGGYGMVSCINEGYPIAEWLNTLGITAFVLKYRLPATEGVDYRHPAPLDDLQRAIRLVRTSAVEYGIRCDRIGVVGFSAGGHLAATGCTLYDRPVHPGTVSCRPDFALLLYPVIVAAGSFAHGGSHANLTGPAPSPELLNLLSPEQQVTGETPPMFLAHARNDMAVPYQNSEMMADALHAHGVPYELHLYEQGGHGFGLGAPEHDCSQWPQTAAKWLSRLGDNGL